MKTIQVIASSLLLIAVFSCTRYEKTNNAAVTDFELEKYLGKWYEIARLDHSFERGCSDVTANYSKRGDGKIKVVNRCIKNGEKDIATAVAYPVQEGVGHLRVSFFRPFYGNYKVIYLDEKYQTAIIDGGSTGYFWILSRNKLIKPVAMKKLLKIAQDSGFDTGKLIYTKHQ